MSRSLAAALVLAAPAAAFAERAGVADLHAEGDLRHEAIGISVVVTEALARAGGVELASRTDLAEALEGAKLPARTGLWLSPTEVRGVAAKGHLKSIVVGTLRRDAAHVYVTLHLVDSEGKVQKSLSLSHPLRELTTLAEAVGEKIGKWLGVPPPRVPTLRRMTLAAIGRAWVALQKKDVDAAVADLERAAHDAAQEPVLVALANQIRTVADGPTLRIRALLAVDAKAALPEAQKFAAENASQMAARVLLARAFLALDQRKEALEVLKPRAGDPDMSELHSLRAAAMLPAATAAAPSKPDKKRAKDVKLELGKAVELNGDNTDAFYLLGDHLAAGTRYLRVGDPRAVSELLQVDARQVDVTQLVPADATTLEKAKAGTYGHALARVLAGDLAGATRELQVAPKEEGGARLLGLLEAEQGHHEAAMTAFAQTAPLDAGREARAAGKRKEARDFLSRAVTVAANEPTASRDLGQVFLEEGDAAGAVVRLRRALTAMPDDAELHALLARALIAAGDTVGAAAENKLAMAIDPELSQGAVAVAAGAPQSPAPSVLRQPAPSKPRTSLFGLSALQLGAIAAGVVVIGILSMVALRRRVPKRERMTFGAMSATDKPAPVATPAPPTRAATPSPATLARTQDARAVRPPSAEAHPTVNDPPSMPGLAALMIEVVDFATVEIPGAALTMREKRPLFGAAVWVGGDEGKAARTDKSSGGAVLYVPPGEHTLHVRAGDKLLEQVLTVTSPKRVALTVDMADETVVPRQPKP